ncbi:bifunctional ABC1 atypical kinase-like domain/Protein kinase-like domain superfamily/ADCK3-like domain/Protein kinase domain [Babesia duncani]|uniref:Bifunctional ABC1 atypical kinase-like domain/Protein kinase-like domain superfamily/ADCK3-like domain/Protein kinase domain n=1 Tax=Babesia duncani TaxID=323732 RepID=A0AAD9PLF9_9APIC|nr:bifunctional ABC1 atypical kinase-like domain/Protein kinase-like domain superfamily/ADCK3-like domain/Protein kinase domain [Babesia duncani]
MRVSRRFLSSHLKQYQEQNLKFIEKGNLNCRYCIERKKTLDTFILLSQTKPLLSFGCEIFGLLSKEILSKCKNVKYNFRNTMASDMDASQFNLKNALGSLNRLRSVKPGVAGMYDKRQFSTKPPTDNREMLENHIPSDRFSRAAAIAGLVVNVASNTAMDVISRYVQGERQNVIKQSLSSDKNVKLLVDCLCKMRGTALKFGQLLSLQYGILPEVLRKALIQVRHHADIMPRWQVEDVMSRELGKDWIHKFKSFDFNPIASASLGQVHKAVCLDGQDVAVKIQFPGVAASISSDIDNLQLICKTFGLLPERFFVDQFANELKVELQSECNYVNEAQFYEIFRQLQLDGFHIPQLITPLCTSRVLTLHFVEGIPIENTRTLSQDVRNSIGDRLLHLSLCELFLFGLMNTDPNPSNYLYNATNDVIGLVDFGSCRRFSPKFVSEYFELVKASVEENDSEIIRLSSSLGFLSEKDSIEMKQCHLASVLITGEPFRTQGRFDFGSSDIIKQLRRNASVILQKRTQPPPPEVYSLHRKLAGCYVICQMINAKVAASDIYHEIASAFTGH